MARDASAFTLCFIQQQKKVKNNFTILTYLYCVWNKKGLKFSLYLLNISTKATSSSPMAGFDWNSNRSTFDWCYELPGWTASIQTVCSGEMAAEFSSSSLQQLLGSSYNASHAFLSSWIHYWYCCTWYRTTMWKKVKYTCVAGPCFLHQWLGLLMHSEKETSLLASTSCYLLRLLRVIPSEKREPVIDEIGYFLLSARETLLPCDDWQREVKQISLSLHSLVPLLNQADEKTKMADQIGMMNWRSLVESFHLRKAHRQLQTLTGSHRSWAGHWNQRPDQRRTLCAMGSTERLRNSSNLHRRMNNRIFWG